MFNKYRQHPNSYIFHFYHRHSLAEYKETGTTTSSTSEIIVLVLMLMSSRVVSGEISDVRPFGILAVAYLSQDVPFQYHSQLTVINAAQYFPSFSFDPYITQFILGFIEFVLQYKSILDYQCLAVVFMTKYSMKV